MAPPDFARLRRRWRYPFGCAILATPLLALLLVTMWRSAAGRVTAALLCTGPVMLVALLLGSLALWSRSATWLQVRVEAREGRWLTFSLPAPFRLAGGSLALARRLAPASARGGLEEADTLLRDVRTLPPGGILCLAISGADEAPGASDYQGCVEIMVG